MTRERFEYIQREFEQAMAYQPSFVVDSPLIMLGETIKALELARADLEMAHQIGDTFWEALKPLNLPAINVANPGSHVSDLIRERDSAIMEGLRLTVEKDGIEQEIDRLKRGEWICLKCGIRKDGESVAADF